MFNWLKRLFSSKPEAPQQETIYSTTTTRRVEDSNDSLAKESVEMSEAPHIAAAEAPKQKKKRYYKPKPKAEGGEKPAPKAKAKEPTEPKPAPAPRSPRRDPR